MFNELISVHNCILWGGCSGLGILESKSFSYEGQCKRLNRGTIKLTEKFTKLWSSAIFLCCDDVREKYYVCYIILVILTFSINIH